MKVTVNKAPNNGKRDRRPPMSPGKAAWLQRKAERARKRAEENKELERLGMIHTQHYSNDQLRKMKGLEIIEQYRKALQDADALKATVDHHGESTSKDVCAIKHEIERRAKKAGWKPTEGFDKMTDAADFLVKYYGKAIAARQNKIHAEIAAEKAAGAQEREGTAAS